MYGSELSVKAENEQATRHMDRSEIKKIHF